MKHIIFILLLSAANAFSSTVFKCTYPGGKNTFSDQPCKNGAQEEKAEYKELPWTRSLEATKPAGTKITDITSREDDTLITYEFRNQADVTAFMRTIKKQSKKNVTLLKFKSPKNNGYGEALLQVTSKQDTIFNHK